MGRFSTGMRGPSAIKALNDLDDAVGGALDGVSEAVAAALGYRNEAAGFAEQAQTAVALILGAQAAAEAAAATAIAQAVAAGESATAADEAEQAASASATAAHADAVAADASTVLAGQHAASAGSSAATAGTARGEAVQAATDAGAAADLVEGYRDTIAAAIATYGNGWTPAIVGAIDGERRVHRILDWTGGTGVKPPTGYLGESGLVATAAEAINVRGAAGESGAGSGTVSTVLGIAPGSDGNVSFEIADIPGLQAALAAAGQVKTIAGVSPDGSGDVPKAGLAAALADDFDSAGTAENQVAILADGLAPIAMSGSWNDLEDKPAVIGAGGTQQAARTAIGLGSVDNVGAVALRDRATHTGTQTISTVTGLQAALDAKVATTDAPALVRTTTLTGLAAGTATPVVATDTVLSAVAKLQAQLGGAAAGGIPIGALVPMPASKPNLVVDGAATYLRTGVVAPAADYPLAPSVNTTVGSTYTTVSKSPSARWSVVYAASKFVAVDSAYSTVSWTSPDGLTWTPRVIPEDNWYQVFYAAGLFIAVSGDTQRTARSVDGITWVSGTALNLGSGPIQTAVGAGRIVQWPAGFTDTIRTSTDGINWAYQAVSSNSYGAIAFGSGKFVVVPGNGSTTVATSTTGTSWTYTASAFPSIGATAIASSGSLFVAVSSATRTYATSADGISWVTRSLPATVTGAYLITYGSGVFVAVATGGATVLVSSDGITWVTSALPATTNWLDVAVGANTVVVVPNTSYGNFAVSLPPASITDTQIAFFVDPGSNTRPFYMRVK